MKKLQKDICALLQVLDIFDNPKKFGCSWNLGDDDTYEERVGWIMDAARDARHRIEETIEKALTNAD